MSNILKTTGWTLLLSLFSTFCFASDEFSFELEEFEKKPLEVGGYAEVKWEHLNVNGQGALAALNPDQATDSTLDRLTGSLRFDGSYVKGIAGVHWLLRASGHRQEDEWYDTADVFEGYLSLKPSDNLTGSVGKKACKWGKGYAWNPVGFINRPKDPNNPEEALEGYITAEADYIKSFSGDLQNIALTTALLPVTRGVNEDFGKGENLNLAAKLYLLYRDTDIDFLLYTGNSRSSRLGVDFSRNITTNFEVHGEYAFLRNLEKIYLQVGGSPMKREEDAHSLLLGVRYLSESKLTSIIEYYHNGAGYSEDELSDFYQLVEDGAAAKEQSGNMSLLQQAGQLGKQGYTRANAGKNYLYGRFSLKEPWDILYFIPALTGIVNLDDGSFSLTPELLYTGFTNWEIRLRFSLLGGGAGTEYGEKVNDNKAELRVRWFF